MTVMQVDFLLEGTESEERRAVVNWFVRFGSLVCKAGIVDKRP
jgi:hypothetical protein